MQVVRGKGAGRRLAVGDVPARVARAHFVEVRRPRRSRSTGPVSSSSTGCAPGDAAGTRGASRSARDWVREGMERVTLQIRFNRQQVIRTVRVVD